MVRVADQNKRRNSLHGEKSNGKVSTEYTSWQLMHDRCRNTNNKSYNYYGGKGIKVCERWSKFENFLADMGRKPEGMTLDRIDGSRDYEPSNCRWETRKTQSRNRDYCISINFDGQEKKLWQIAEEKNIPVQLIHQRLHHKWSLERAINQPIRVRK